MTHRHSDRCCNDCGAHQPGTCTGCDSRALRAAKVRAIIARRNHERAIQRFERSRPL